MSVHLEKGFKLLENGDVLVPPGVYYIGDPCYAVDHAEEGKRVWSELLESSGFFESSPIATCDDFVVVASDTKYGDGCYRADGPAGEIWEFGVDAGMIGIVPESLIEKFKDWYSHRNLVRVEFTRQIIFKMVDEDGVIEIGPIKVFTGKHVGWGVEDEDEDEDWED